MSTLAVTGQLKALFLSTGVVSSTNAAWDGFVVQPFANSRFAVAKDLSSIIDTTQVVVHRAPANVDVMYRAFQNIDGLTNDRTLSVLYMYALSVKPIMLPEDVLRGTDGPKAFFLGKSYVSNQITPNDIVWLYPDGGIESTREGYKYVPMCSRYAVNEDGELWDLTDNEAVPINTNDTEGVKLTTDSGDEVRLPLLDIVTLAFGKYNIYNYTDPAFSTVDIDHDDYGKLSTTHKAPTKELDTHVTLDKVGPHIVE